MAKISFFFLGFVLSVVYIVFASSWCYAFHGRETAETSHDDHHFTHTIKFTTLLPSTVCDSSSKADERKSSLKVVHKHGPCLQLDRDNKEKTSVSKEEMLRLDQSRVDSIHSSLRSKKHSGSHGGDITETDASTKIPAKDGRVIGSGNYIVTVGLGTPKKDLSLEFDTGSDLTWTQCQPCVRSCYKQNETIFDPKVSKTYTNISCSSDLCNSLQSDKGILAGCDSSNSTCLYGIQYLDMSSSIGFLGKETLTLTPTDVIPNFLFGCGQDNQGLFRGAAGLIGLGRDSISLVSQTAQKYKKIFSYCLPSSPSATGHLTLGDGGVLKSTKFTPLSTMSQGTSFYGLDVTGISVGGQKLSIPASIFSTSGTIIDSGAVITRLPPTTYSSMKSAFQKKMSQYPKAPAFSIFDTCYDFSKNETITFPTVSFTFKGATEVNIAPVGIFVPIKATQVCLAFAPNRNDSDVAIFGNVQQKTMEIVYDVAGGRVGFAPGGCT